jgi:hypothetical protein
VPEEFGGTCGATVGGEPVPRLCACAPSGIAATTAAAATHLRCLMLIALSRQTPGLPTSLQMPGFQSRRGAASFAS